MVKLLTDVLRNEKKYLVSTVTAHMLRQSLEQLLRKDMHNAGGKGYTVRSLYFDTLDDRDYYDKAEGYDDRRKIRLRVYHTDGDTAKLEVKEKSKDKQRKRSLTVSREDAQAFANGDYSRLLSYPDRFAVDLYVMLNEYAYRPKCIVEYDRCAFCVPENDTRVTLDSKLRATESAHDLFSRDLSFYPVTHEDHVTLELKYNHFLLSYVKDIVSACNRTQVSMSKYCLSRSIGCIGVDV